MKKAQSQKELKLKADNILIAEYKYAAETAFQSNEDRARVFSFVIANILTLTGAVVIPAVNNSIPQELFAVIFILLSIMGILALLQLARLRVAFIDSIKTMNTIKGFYEDEFKDSKLSKAFRWNSKTIPAATKTNSLSFLFAFNLMVINAFALSMAVFLLKPGGVDNQFLISEITAFVCLVVQLVLWNSSLSHA